MFNLVKDDFDENMDDIMNSINKIINEYFDIRHNEYLNKAKQKREVLNDKDFIEYLYNRIYSLLFLLRIKCNKEESSEI